jgi:2-polyprenyl-3-methyl-5-hydroxy-6-metoxy-1,4-benzoquinol methylase
MQEAWQKAQERERSWHGNCVNSYHEETKQLHYAERMGLEFLPEEWTYPTLDVQGRSVLDLGGGAYSLLLKCRRLGPRSAVLDPCVYPPWTDARYAAAGVRVLRVPAETYTPAERWDEVWIYNVLQHVVAPARVIERALAWGRVVRLYEWIETAVDECHPHRLTRDDLEAWLGAPGYVETYLRTRAFYGVFAGGKAG